MKKWIAVWGISGIVALVVRALWRLTPIAVEPIVAGNLSRFQWVAMTVWVLANAYLEGYRGFHLRFSPRTVARAFYLAEHPTALRVLLAPAFCMGLFGATRRVLITAWSVLLMVVGLVLVIRTLEQPWRGIVDAGVVVGLFLGTLSLLWIFVRRIFGTAVDFDPGVPAEAAPSALSSGSASLES